PLLISGDDLQYLSPAECREKVQQTPVAIPGQNTTAHFLFSQAFPGSEKKVFLRFDEVEEWVLSGNGIGVIIHENRFTYAQKGLHLVADLGSIWEQQTGLPIPLGGIVAKRTLPQQVVQGINNAIQKSLTLAWEKYPELSDFVRSNAQEMQEHVMREHIQLYVNDFSMDMQQSGRRAIMRMMEVMAGKKLSKEESIFL
ncbi:MAG TPA: MqnA/MqnD/SBP family protein, partial [Phnomibacter sp.]|nr:MqnA/MqnD/SBP family protein [Phnomibacter sp.]